MRRVNGTNGINNSVFNMNRPRLTHRTPLRIAVGEKGQFTRTLSDGEVALFIGVTWDVNPLHTDDSFAAQTRFGRCIVPGLLTASLLTTEEVIGER